MFKQYIEATIMAPSMTLKYNSLWMILPSQPSTSSIVLYTDLDWRLRATALRVGVNLAGVPDVYHKRTEHGPHQRQLYVVIQRVATGCGAVVMALEGFVVPEPVDKLNRQSHIDRDGDHLEDNTTQHNPSTFLGALMIPGRDRCEGSANTLDSQGDEISSDEHDGICD